MNGVLRTFSNIFFRIADSDGLLVAADASGKLAAAINAINEKTPILLAFVEINITVLLSKEIVFDCICGMSCVADHFKRLSRQIHKIVLQGI